MRQVVNAVFEKGVFRPTASPQLLEGDRVRLTVEGPGREEAEVEDMLNSVAGIYEGLSPAEIAEIERIALDRSQFSVGLGTP